MDPFKPNSDWYEQYWFSEESAKPRSRISAFLFSFVASSVLRMRSERRVAERADIPYWEQPSQKAL